MFTGFNLCIEKEDWIHELLFDDRQYERYVEEGKKHLEEQKASYETNIEKYINERKIDGTKVQNDWFPQVEADVFISHSRDDEELACALAGWLYKKFNLRCFIDANVWGYSRVLLEEMNKKLSDMTEENGMILYDHESCVRVSQHVDTMLSIALQKMIDKVETVILLNTKNAVQVYDDMHMSETYSPWIYSEIICTEIVRKKPLLVYRDYPIDEEITESVQHGLGFLVSYGVSLKHLKTLELDDLRKWENKYTSKYYQYALDALYEFKCDRELMRTQKLFSELGENEVNRLKKLYLSNGGEEECIGEAVCENVFCVQENLWDVIVGIENVRVHREG